MIDGDIHSLLEIHDEYADGKINLKEAIRRAQFILSLPEESLEKLFKDIERNNIMEIGKI